jgi:glycosyltransferase involved in cell wall biosynthesis
MLEILRMSVRVSVIMAAYNGERYIADSIRSVQEQSFRDHELIVVDDGSTDRTREIAQAARAGDDRVVYVHQENGRQAKARNLGLRHARGELIAFLDQDDLWVKDKLALQVAALDQLDADVVYSDGFLFPDGHHHDEQRVFRILTGRFSGDEMFQLMFFRNQIPILSALVRKRAIARVGLLNEDPAFQNCDDYDLWIRLAKSGARFVGMPERLVRYRLHAGQASHNMAQMLTAEILVLQRHRDHPLCDQKLVNARLRKLYEDLALVLTEERRLDEARRWTWQWVRDEPGWPPLFQAAVLKVCPGQYRRIHKLRKGVRYGIGLGMESARGVVERVRPW